MPDETLGIRLCGASLPAPALMGPERVRTPFPRRVCAFCVVVACLCCEFALCLCVVSSLCVCVACLRRVIALCVCVASLLSVCVACLRCVSVSSVRVAGLCCVCAMRVCVVCVACGCRVSPCEEGSLGRSAQPGGDACVLVGRIIAGLRAPPRTGRLRQGRKVLVYEVCDF